MAPKNADLSVEDARHRMRKWLQQLYQHRVCGCFTEETGWLPSADIHETEEAFHVFVELAGLSPDAIELVVDGSTLCLQGERKRPPMTMETRVHQMEIDFGKFRRSFNFPSPLDSERAHTYYHQGLLEITLPKLKQTGRPVRIMLKSR